MDEILPSTEVAALDRNVGALSSAGGHEGDVAAWRVEPTAVSLVWVEVLLLLLQPRLRERSIH